MTSGAETRVERRRVSWAEAAPTTKRAAAMSVIAGFMASFMRLVARGRGSFRDFDLGRRRYLDVRSGKNDAVRIGHDAVGHVILVGEERSQLRSLRRSDRLIGDNLASLPL